MVGEDGSSIQFDETVVGNRSPLDTPLMGHISSFLEREDPGAAAVPVVLPGFSDSRWFRSAFPDCIAYGFFPQRTMDMFEALPLVHGADERVPVADLGLAATVLRRPGRGGAAMTRAVPEEKLRLGGMALRNGLLVHGPTHWAAAVRDDAGRDPGGVGTQARLGARAAERVPGLRGVLKLGEAMAVIPLVKRALPAARLPMQDARTLGAMGAAALARPGDPLRRRAHGGPRGAWWR